MRDLYKSNDNKRGSCLMLILGLNEAMDQLVMANNMHWSGHALWRLNLHVFSTTLELEILGQRRTGDRIFMSSALHWSLRF